MNVLVWKQELVYDKGEMIKLSKGTTTLAFALIGKISHDENPININIKQRVNVLDFTRLCLWV
jgi:hypothetical protein